MYGEDLSKEDSFGDESSQSKRRISKKASKRKGKPLQSRKTEDIEDSQILQIKRMDETSRDHIRPAFLRRWDGGNQLDLTEEQFAEMSPMFEIYWRVKCKNMNVIIFLELGRIECLALEDDAIRMHEMFKKNLYKYSRFLMVKFFKQELELVKRELFERNIPMMMMKEFDDPQYRELHGIKRREVQEVITPAFHISMHSASFRERLAMCVYRSQHSKQGSFSYGIVTVDTQNNRFTVEQVTDNTHLHEIRRLMNRYRPAEVILRKGDREVYQMAKQICKPYIVQFSFRNSPIEEVLVKLSNSSGALLFKSMLSLFQEEKKTRDASESQSYSAVQQFSSQCAVRALDLLYQYLQSLNLQQKIFHQGIFSLDHKENPPPFFDSQVYDNLEIFRLSNDENYGTKGTLVAYLDVCKTIQGKKLLHKWIDQPLTILEQIKQRQEALHEIVEKRPEVLDAHALLTPFEKLESSLTEIYHWVVRKSQEGRILLTCSMTFEKQYKIDKNPAAMQLKEILRVLRLLLLYQDTLRSLAQYQFSSPYLRAMIHLVEIDDLSTLTLEQVACIKGIPKIGSLVQSIRSKINEDKLEPAEGVSEVFDFQNKNICSINALLQEELGRWRAQFKCDKISFVSVRSRNELQFPKSICKGKPHPDLIFSSETSAVIRYTTATTYSLSEQLIEHEREISHAYEPFLQQVIRQFCRYKYIWDIYVRSLSRIDLILSLATVGSQIKDNRCLAQFVPPEEGVLNIEEGVHVSLLQIKENTVSNSLNLTQARVLIITGPNMGGKSTFLKQTCLLATMAQMGIYLPCRSYKSIIFDQIFCRIGASDRILEGKSTFYVQLEETKRILTHATANSLIIIDELGRGTSTYDGMAIAEATLHYIMREIGAFTLFSTHYTEITEQFLQNQGVSLKKLGYKIVRDDVQFTYQIEDGVAEKSFANSVGRSVNILPSILERAQEVGEQMRKQRLEKKREKLRSLFQRTLQWVKQT